MTPLTSQEIKDIELGVLDYVVSMCQKHQLRYFLAYGTLLGAVRHKGFIPWDDDIDLLVPRPDYDRLLDLIKQDNHPYFKALSMKDDGYYDEWGRVHDARTLVEEHDVVPMRHGVWVDLFPMDGAPAEDKPARWRFTLLTRPRVAAIHTALPSHLGGGAKRAAMWLVWKFSRLMGYRFFLKRTDRLSRKHDYDRSPFVGYLADYGSKKHIYPRALFDAVDEVSFEGRTLVAPADYDTLLTSLYGDYMKLPPEDKRVPHRMEAYRK